MTDEVYVVGRSRENARRLLAIARDLDLETSVVRTTDGGYLVPEDVAAVYDGQGSKEPEPKPEATEEPKAQPKRKRRRTKKSEETTEDTAETQDKE